MQTKSVLIIGAGIGGLTTAARLAKHGYAVRVLEKNKRAGGRCYRYTREGHHFDLGPTLFVMPELYEDGFSDLGIDMWEALDLQRVDPTYHLYFGDGTQLTLTSDMRKMHIQLESFEEGSFENFLRYINEGNRHYRLALDRLVQRDFQSYSDLIRPDLIPLLFQIRPLTAHYKNMGNYFDDPRLKAAFTFQDMYMGLSPFEAPATFSMMQYTELSDGVWFPSGGMYRVVEVLKECAEKYGAQFEFSAPVEKILASDGKACGVRLNDGRSITADIIIANADLPYVYQDLLPNDPLARSMDSKRYSCSTLSFFWGVKKRYDSLPPHVLYLSPRYRENFDSIIQDCSIPEDPSLYFHAPTRLESSFAPDGEDTIIGIVPVGHLSNNGHQDWNKIKKQARSALLSKLKELGVNDFESHLKFEVCYSPRQWKQQFNLVKGATHGLCHTLNQMVSFRPSNRHKRYKNLYFVGASTHPGTGMPTVMVSGRLVSDRVVREWGHPKD